MSMLPPQMLHDRDGTIWMDGKILPWRESTLHVLTHGLHYASSVFEGMRAYDGQIFKLGEHIQRLFDSAATLAMAIPFPRQQLQDISSEMVSTPELANSYIRPLVWRGSESIGIGVGQTTIHTAIAAWPLPSYFVVDADNPGIRLATAKWRRPPPDTSPYTAKAAGLYTICTLAKLQAETNGFDDALMLDWQGRVAEATCANIFFVINGALHTPLPTCFLDGITRQTIIDMAKAHDIPVFERAIWPEEIKNANEVFITGTAAEITPVRQIDSDIFAIGPFTKLLSQTYATLVRQDRDSLLKNADRRRSFR